VYGQGTARAELDTRSAPTGIGVYGRGDLHGVYGVSTTLRDIEIPTLALTTPGHPSVEPIGVVGVNAALSDNAPAIFGDNN
jgi:hypothetical protein